MNQPVMIRALREAREAPDEKAVVRALFEALESARISHCHWKSNVRLGDTLAGQEDIDILVDRRQARDFQRLIAQEGFKLANATDGTEHPSTFHAIALDRESGELVDLHVCHLVYSGDSLVKNYRLPIEQHLLHDTRRLLGVTVPQPELELVYFVLRIALKHLSLVEILKSNRSYGKTVAELRWLEGQADRGKTLALRAALFPEIDEALFLRLLEVLERPGALLQRIVLGYRIARRLRRLRRLGTFGAFLSRTKRTLAYAASRLTRRKPLCLQTGGAIIAIVGPKATGKSTLADAVAKRLGRHLDVVRIHTGKPPATLVSWLPTRFVPIARKLLPHERLSEYETPERREKRNFSLFYVARMTLLAHDRRRLLDRARRKAAAGAIIVTDRYPTQVAGAIDSSCFDDEAIARCGSRLKRWLMRMERRFYDGMPRPDLVIRLEAPLELALSRDASRNKAGGPNAEAVRRRWELETGTVFDGSKVVALGTSQPLDRTIASAVEIAWSEL